MRSLRALRDQGCVTSNSKNQIKAPGTAGRPSRLSPQPSELRAISSECPFANTEENLKASPRGWWVQMHLSHHCSDVPPPEEKVRVLQPGAENQSRRDPHGGSGLPAHGPSAMQSQNTSSRADSLTFKRRLSAGSRMIFSVILIMVHVFPGVQGQPKHQEQQHAFYGTTNGYEPSRLLRSYPNIAPQIVSPDQTFRSELGDRLVLPCQVANLDKFVLMWKQGSRVLTAGQMVVRKDTRIQLKDDYSLEISDLRAEDQDTYTCEIDILGQPISIQHHVEVLVPPAVQAMPRDGIVSTRKGNDVTLRCSGRGNPNPRITWTKRSGVLPSRKPSEEGLSLILKNVDREHGGVYVCTATNGVGRPATAEINVQVKYPPEIEIEQNWYQRDGKIEVELNCNVYARPDAEVFWYRRQKKLHETDRQLFQSKPNRVTLHIRQVNPSDFGNYSCRAENVLGKARTYTSLSGHPRPPRFTSDSIGYRAHSYNITWTTDSFSPITEYKLLYRRSDGLPIEQKGQVDEHSGLWEMVAIPVSDPTQAFSTYASYTLKNLHPGAVYDVIAKANNHYGWSDWSKTFNCFNKGVDYSTQQLADRGSDFLINEALDLTENGHHQQQQHQDSSPTLVGADLAFSQASPTYFGSAWRLSLSLGIGFYCIGWVRSCSV